MIRSFKCPSGTEEFENNVAGQRLALRRLNQLRKEQILEVENVVFYMPELSLLLTERNITKATQQIWELIRLLVLLRELKAVKMPKSLQEKFGKEFLESRLISYKEPAESLLIQQLNRYYRNTTKSKTAQVEILANYLGWTIPITS